MRLLPRPLVLEVRQVPSVVVGAAALQQPLTPRKAARPALIHLAPSREL